MNETCTLIKNSELAELRNVVSNCNASIKDAVESATAQLRNDISEKDKEIEALKNEIEEMKDNPQIDPMKMTLYFQKVGFRLLNDGYGSFHEERFIQENVIEPVNFNLSDPLKKQIQNMLNIFTKRDREITDKEIGVKSNNMLKKISDDLILNFSKKGYFERKKLIKEIKNQ